MPLLKEEYTKEEKHYNADEVITLKDFPNISMTLAEMFENVE